MSSGGAFAGFDVGDAVRVIAKHDERIWKVGKISRRCDASETGDYLVEFDGDPQLHSYRGEDLYPAKGLQDRGEAPAKGRHRPGLALGSESEQLPVGWYPDPATGGERYWNGHEWAGQDAGTKYLSRPSSLIKTGLGLLIAIIIGFAAHACATKPNTQTPPDRHVPANTTTVSP